MAVFMELEMQIAPAGNGSIDGGCGLHADRTHSFAQLRDRRDLHSRQRQGNLTPIELHDEVGQH